MSFLIFAYRKLSLKRQVSDGEYRQMSLSQQKDTISKQIGQMQQCVSVAKNIFNTLSNQVLATVESEVYSKYPNGVPQDQQNSIMQEVKAKQYAVMTANSTCASIFESASNAQLSQLKGQESQIDLETASLESQLKIMREEAQGVEKGESDAAKSDAPKFGLG